MYWTIDGFEKLTEQEVVNISVAHVLKNGRPSLKEGTDLCAYSGIGCGAAPFLKEENREKADNQGEEEGVDSSWCSLERTACVPLIHHKLVQVLQSCHDDAAITSAEYDLPFITAYKDYVRRLVNDYNPTLSLPFTE